jgi:hypothetical protein
MGLLVSFWLIELPDHPVPDIAAFTVSASHEGLCSVELLHNLKVVQKNYRNQNQEFQFVVEVSTCKFMASQPRRHLQHL